MQVDWEHKYVGPSKLSPQQKALKKRARSGLKMASPKTTQERVAVILDLMQRGMWFRGSSVVEYAAKWRISVKRAQQLAAEANRNNG